MAYIKDPKSIEARSFEIITETLGDKLDKFSESEKLIVNSFIRQEILIM